MRIFAFSETYITPLTYLDGPQKQAFFLPESKRILQPQTAGSNSQLIARGNITSVASDLIPNSRFRVGRVYI